jgi:hypothetical protein
MLRNLVTSLFRDERINTTEARAKEVKSIAETRSPFLWLTYLSKTNPHELALHWFSTPTLQLRCFVVFVT